MAWYAAKTWAMSEIPAGLTCEDVLEVWRQIDEQYVPPSDEKVEPDEE